MISGHTFQFTCHEIKSLVPTNFHERIPAPFTGSSVQPSGANSGFQYPGTSAQASGYIPVQRGRIRVARVWSNVGYPAPVRLNEAKTPVRRCKLREIRRHDFVPNDETVKSLPRLFATVIANFETSLGLSVQTPDESA
jgi:hypothetical protein